MTPAGASLGYTVGILFESYVYHQLRALSQPLDATVYHYRDSNGHEADAIVSLPDRRWAAFEVKLSQDSIDQAANSLHKFVQQVDLNRTGPPSALVVITATGYSYRRPDGVSLVPISALMP